MDEPRSEAVDAGPVRAYSDRGGLVELEHGENGLLVLPEGVSTFYVALPEADRP